MVYGCLKFYTGRVKGLCMVVEVIFVMRPQENDKTKVIGILSAHPLSLGSVTLKLTLKAPIATKVVCFTRLLKCLRSLYGKHCGPRSDYMSSLFWVHTVCFYTKFVSNVRHFLQQTTSADKILRFIFFLAL